jgi:dolichyl-diphosphooligosaccharide--protein glycosyltransferase
MMTARSRSAVAVGFAVALAFAVRVIPAYRVVFSAFGVNFQDDDSWSHMRGVHNLVAHFPKQSGFDPYGLFPGGAVVQREPWDLAVAAVAWILGTGNPSASLVDDVGAWLPAVLGALLPILVFFLARRLFGDLAGSLAAIAVAVIPGTLLWETHLGVPDHHVAECLLSLAALTLLIEAAERPGRARMWLTAAAGFSLGLYLCVRPAGIFVPGTFAIAVLLEPALAAMVTAAVALAAVIFLASAGSAWSEFTWFSLAGSVTACLLAWALNEIWQRRHWRRIFLLPAAATGLLITVGAMFLVRRATFFALVATIARYLPNAGDPARANTVSELYPLWKFAPGGFTALFENLGGLWILAFAFLAFSFVTVWRARRPALTLFMVWAVVMTAGGFIQVRMVLYLGVVLAVAVGAGAAWIIDRLRRSERTLKWREFAIATSIVVILAANLPYSLTSAGFDGGLDAGWLAALTWLSRNTPEPMEDPAAWSKFWPAIPEGKFSYPPSAYGVLTWWQYGDQVRAFAHRIPNTNGTQAQATPVAQFLTETDPDQARSFLGKMGTRYVMLNSILLTTNWPSLIIWADSDDTRFRKKVYGVSAGGTGVPVVIYMQDFYRSMAARLYLYDGRPSGPRVRFTVYTTRRLRANSGLDYDVLISQREFPSEQKAFAYMAANTGETMVMGSTDPTVSCVALEDLPWARQVFTSDETPLAANRAAQAVKVFEVAR